MRWSASSKMAEPIPFGPGTTREQSGWSLRVVEHDSELVLQNLTGDEWADVYDFLPQPVPLIDVETSSWWTSTHPRSLFVTGLIVGDVGMMARARFVRPGRALPQAGNTHGHERDAAGARGHTGAARHAVLAAGVCARRGRARCPATSCV